MERSVKATQELIEDYEDAIEELSEEDRGVINAWLKAVEMAVTDRKFTISGHKRANFGRSAAIELLHIRLFGNLE